MAELEPRGAEGERAHRALLLDQVRAARSAEAPNITAADELDFASAIRPRAPDITGPNEPADDEARAEPETRHRFPREHDDGRPHARRLIVHRDRRRGRPKKEKDPRRTDHPPEHNPPARHAPLGHGPSGAFVYPEREISGFRSAHPRDPPSVSRA